MKKESLNQPQKPQIFSVKKFLFNKQVAIFLGLFVFICAVIFGAVLWPVVSKRKGFETTIQNKIDSIVEKDFCPKESETPDEGYLCIPQLQVKAPIILSSQADYKDVLPQLEHGVVLAGNTAFPGKIGNSFIIGHSSDLPWKAGDYKNIFLLLDKLKQNDQFLAYYKGQRFIYEVKDTIIVKPSELWVLDQDTSQSIMSLMTCWPPATTLNRLIVRATLVE